MSPEGEYLSSVEGVCAGRAGRSPRTHNFHRQGHIDRHHGQDSRRIYLERERLHPEEGRRGLQVCVDASAYPLCPSLWTPDGMEDQTATHSCQGQH